jgi:serine/threonine protein kinase
MHQADWARLKELFQEAVARTGQDRADFLERTCRAYPHLDAPLRQLLMSDSAAGDFLETPAYAEIVDDTSHTGVTGTLRPGDVVNGTYEVQSTLGAGGMGVVYRVIHRGLKRSFAAKVIHGAIASDRGFRERFEREAVALGRLKHPNIVDVTDYGIEDAAAGRPYLIMECLDGGTLAERLRSGPVPLETALALAVPIAAALDYAHSQGVLHLDLKPANVALRDAGDGSIEVKILDFGVAQFTNEPGESRSAPLAGTPAYLAPELLDGQPAGASADIYAFGVLVYEMLAGRPPFEGTVAEVLEQQRGSVPPPSSAFNPAVPADLDAALLDLLAKDPAARPRTARAALAALRAALTRHRQRDWRGHELPRRLIGAAILGVVLGTISPALDGSSLLRRLEAMTMDARYAAVPGRPASRDIVLLMLDDASLAADPTPLVQRADTFGRDLQRVVAAGARAVAIDFLLPASWSESGPFARLVLEHADRLTLAAYSSAAGEVVGTECIAGTTTVALGPERAAGLFGFINLDQDEDGVSRRGRLLFRDRAGTARPSFAARAASTVTGDAVARQAPRRDNRFWIDHRIDVDRFTAISWKDLDGVLQRQPEAFKGRIVLAGASYAGSGDEARIPARDLVPGIVLHAATLQTILAGFPIRRLDGGGLILLSALASGALCGVVLVLRGRSALVAVAAASLLYCLASVGLLARNDVMVPLVVPLALGLLAAVAGHAIARRRVPYPADEQPSPPAGTCDVSAPESATS